MSEINNLIRKIRGKDSLRTAGEKTGISYTYWSILEKGLDPRSRNPLKPTPETLRAISDGYNYSYEELMMAAGYIEETKKGTSNEVPKSKIDEAVRRIEKEFGITIEDDPVIIEGLENYLRMAGQLKKKSD